MPRDYFYQASPPKHHRILEKHTMNEFWLANGVRPTPLDSPPPPLTGDPGSPASSTWSLPRGPEQATAPKVGHHGTSCLSVLSTPGDTVGHFGAIRQRTNEEQDDVVLRKPSPGDVMLDNSLQSYRPRSSMGDLKSVRHPSQTLEKERRSFQEQDRAPQEKGRARSCEGERGRNRSYGSADTERTQWEMSRLVGFATSTCVEDWEGIMFICNRANHNNLEAKDACKALRRDIKFGLPTTQISASRPWTILMWNCAPYFVTHTTNRKFLGVVEDIALSPTTTSVVRDRLVEVEQLLEALLNANEEADAIFKTYDDIVQITGTVREDTDSPQPSSFTVPILEFGEPFAQSTPSHLLELAKRHKASISKKMTAREVVSHLVAHGCRDLSSELDLSSFDEYPTSHGGLSDVYAGQLLDATKIAVKALRVSTTSMNQDPTHLKLAIFIRGGRCKRPGVIQLLGLAIFRGRIGMVSLDEVQKFI
ncbi:hypothetical protein B0J17DRAFT_723691 [Rhizoctonia solani]|nr:hypothetical protein B0J17DRAFT_723691 [Rhizoctonia solani]